jgi:hypothetical protein
MYFYMHRGRYQPKYCKKCSSKKRTLHGKTSKTKKEYMFKYTKMKNHNLSQSDYERMVVEQNNKCGICKKIMKEPCVDHDHATGEIRGLLCYNCNAAIGLFEDNPLTLMAAIKYLEEGPDLFDWFK